MGFKTRTKQLVYNILAAGALLVNSFGCCSGSQYDKPKELLTDLDDVVLYELMQEHPNEIVDIIKASGDSREQTLGALPFELMDEHSDELVQMTQRYKEHTWGVFAAFGNDVINQEQKNRSNLEHIREAAKEGTGWAYLLLPKDLMETHSDFLIDIAYASGETTGLTYALLPLDIVNEYSEELGYITELIGEDTWKVFTCFPSELMDTYSDELIGIVERYGKHSAALFEVFGKDVVEIEETHRQELENFVRKYGDSVNSLLLKFGEDFEDFEVYNGEINEENQKLFGITHFHRYYMDQDSDLLAENVANLDLDYNPDKPMALVVMNKNDWNDVFAAQKKYEGLESLTNGYKLFIFEVDNEEGAFAAIEQIGTLYGVDDEGNPNKPIDLLILGGHGSQKGLNLGYTSLQDSIETLEDFRKHDDQYLDIIDGEQFQEAAQYISQEGIVVLESCSTGEEGYNLATFVKFNMPYVDVYAPIMPVNHWEFYFDELGLVTNVEFCSEEVYMFRKLMHQDVSDGGCNGLTLKLKT